MDHFIRGAVADAMEDHYRAVFHYQEALRFDSASAFIYVALAQDYILLGSPNQAEQLLDHALRIHSNHVPALELKMLLLRSSGNLPQARELLNRLVQIAPERLEYQQQLLSLNLVMGNFREAEKLRRQIESHSEKKDLLNRQVLAIYLAAGEYERAAGILEEMIAQDSSDAALIFALGNCRLQQGDSIRGEEFIKRANRMEPAEPRYWIARAAIAMNRQDFDAITVLVDSALAYTEPHASFYSLLGLAQYRSGKTMEAISSLERAIELDSTMYVAIGSLALVYDELDSVSLSVGLYERAIRLSDSAATYLNNLAYTYASRGIELTRAKILASRAVNDEPENGAYLDTMGWIEYGLGNYNDAINWLKKAQRADPSNSAAFEHLGDVYMKMGKRSKALPYYRQALDRDPDNETLRRKLEH